MTKHEQPPLSNLILYQTEDGQTRIQCRLEDDSLWLTQSQLAELFETTPQNITLHLKAIYMEAELAEAATCKDYLQVRAEGGRSVTRQLKHYNLPAIIAIGFRVRSHRGTQFRQWASARLEEYLVKGFTMDDERLKNPPSKDQTDYFDELLERADAGKPFMGMHTTRSGGVIRKDDASIAKNYLTNEELQVLNRIVTKAELEYARYHSTQDALPRAVDMHFEAAAKLLNEVAKKLPVRKKPKPAN
jgi:hypothetical protein